MSAHQYSTSLWIPPDVASTTADCHPVLARNHFTSTVPIISLKQSLIDSTV